MMVFGSCNPPGRKVRFLSMNAKMPSQILWNSASTLATHSFAYDACCLLSCFFFVVCNLFLSVSNLSCRLNFLLSLDNLLDLNLHLMYFVLRNPSVQSTWLLQRSVTVCCSFCCFCVTPFFNSASFYSSTSISSSTFASCAFATCCGRLRIFYDLLRRHFMCVLTC